MRRSAPLKKRFLALLIDYIVISAYTVALLGVSLFIFFVVLAGVPKFNELGMNLISLTLIGPVFLFSVFTESSKRHATPGKSKMRLTIVSARPKTLRLWQLIVRNLVKFLPWQLAHMAIFHLLTLPKALIPTWIPIMIGINVLALIWLGFLFRKDHRGVHDLIAGTMVLESRSIDEK